MVVYLESGLSLSLPDGLHFRFSALAAYKRLSCHSLKEMDFAWLHEGRLIVLELKDFRVTTQPLAGGDFLPAKGKPAPHRFGELVDKVSDSLAMLLSCWADTGWGKSLRKELPAAAQRPLPLTLAVAIELPPELRVHQLALRDALNARLRGRMALADVRAIALLDFETLVAHKLFSPFVTRQP